MSNENEGIPIEGEVVQEAKRMGWVEQEKFKGDPDRWVEAEKFVERGKNELPILRERYKKHDSTIKSLRNEISGMKQTFKEFQGYTHDREKKAVERAIKELTNRQRVAVEEGDTKTFDNLEKEKSDLLQEQPTVPQINESEPMEAELQDWIDDGNEWFYSDRTLGDYAATISPYVAKNTTKTGKAYYDEVKKEVMARFPEKFETQKKVTPPAVEGTGEQTPPPQGKQTYANLPADAKAQCDRFIKEIEGFTKEEYVKRS